MKWRTLKRYVRSLSGKEYESLFSKRVASTDSGKDTDELTADLNEIAESVSLESTLGGYEDEAWSILEASGVEPDEYTSHLKDEEYSDTWFAAWQLIWIRELRSLLAENDSPEMRQAIDAALKLQDKRYSHVITQFEIDTRIGQAQRAAGKGAQKYSDDEKQAWWNEYLEMERGNFGLSRNAIYVRISETRDIPISTIADEIDKRR